MYHAFFHLREPPFSIAPDPSFLFLSARHQEALGHLLYGTGQFGGFVQLTGEVGTGKTTIVRTLLSQKLPDVDVAMIHNPRQSEHEFVASICDELHIAYPGGASLKTLVDALNAHLLKIHAAGRRAVLIIDEAQNLQPGVLEQVRLLTNLETDKEKLLRIMLVGQPELAELLARNDLRQLAARITARYHLLPLTREETHEYIRHRMAIAGGNVGVFTSAAIARIYRMTQGIPRQINIVCDRALLGAYSRGQYTVTPEIVARAVDETLAEAPVTAHASAYRMLLHRLRAVPVIWIEAFIACFALIVMLLVLGGAFDFHRRDQVPPAVAPVARPQASEPAAAASEPAKPVAAALTPVSLSGSAALAELRRSAQPLPLLTGQLIRLWRPELRMPKGDNVCRALEQYELACYRGQSDWNELLALNRPALLTLDLGNGDKHYVLLREVGPDSVVLLGADGPRRYKMEQIDGLWTGEFLMLWYKPSAASPAGPQTRGEPVLWLRQQLALAGDSTVDTGSVRYDNGLLEAVRRFQQSHAINANGIAGKRTLIALSDLSPRPEAPVLRADKTP